MTAATADILDIAAALVPDGHANGDARDTIDRAVAHAAAKPAPDPDARAVTVPLGTQIVANGRGLRILVDHPDATVIARGDCNPLTVDDLLVIADADADRAVFYGQFDAALGGDGPHTFAFDGITIPEHDTTAAIIDRALARNPDDVQRGTYGDGTSVVHVWWD